MNESPFANNLPIAAALIVDVSVAFGNSDSVSKNATKSASLRNLGCLQHLVRNLSRAALRASVKELVNRDASSWERRAERLPRICLEGGGGTMRPKAACFSINFCEMRDVEWTK